MSTTLTMAGLDDIDPVGDMTVTPIRGYLRIVRPVSIVLVTSMLTALHGFLPSLVGSATSWYASIGAARCGSLSVGSLLDGVCTVVGGPSGAEVGNGWLVVVIETMFMRLLAMPAEWAVASTAFVLIGIAVLGVVALLQDLGIKWPIGLGAAVAFLASPTIIGMAGFGSTFFGMALVPAGICASLRLGRIVAEWQLVRSVAAMALWVLLSFSILQIDGYGFVLTQASVAALLVGRLIFWPSRRQSLAALLGFVSSNGLAYLIYGAMQPSDGDWAKSSIDLFRAMGADVVTMLRPTSSVWWATPLGIDMDVSELWGDGTNARFNYLGLVVVLLAAAAVVISWKRDRRLVIWLVIGVAALFLALGPSLKINEVRGPLAPPISYQSYLMPSEAGVVVLPSQWLYETLPGFEFMRATYRWMVLVRLATIVLAAYMVQWMISRGGRSWAAVGVGVGLLALVELMPNAQATIEANSARAAQIDSFNEAVIDDLDDALPDGARVVFAPNSSGGNDFLASYLATGANLNTPNVGGDKALENARKERPEAIAELLGGPDDFGAAAQLVLEEGHADFVVVPYFDLRWSINQWPATGEFSTPGQEAAAEARTDSDLTVVNFTWFAVISLSHS
ncbi:hypothetical protein SAMN05216410_2609 [Sanguibacter gelidistatuariae]|uniref:Glucosyl transferase GtrII n=1 Tax=Sanguibacter gelidistatuariae TaxID=1814289 RepID=A0A1G6QRW9_9MICO|nr:hypothetical protein [Sanguibacter gelidistatuariae]SDC94466.1 hypothetical protein SAMN05216410_2609 [Sanguibacter gelidistatuariae]